MKKVVCLVVLTIFYCSAFAQKVVLYYKIDKIVPTDKFARLDSLISKIKPGSYEVSIVGFADYLHNNRYNDALSMKRAEKAKEKLLKSTEGFTFNITLLKAEGESFSKENKNRKGESSQRKVEITFKSLRKLSATKPGNTHPQRPSATKNPGVRPTTTVTTPTKPAPGPGLDNMNIMQSGDTFALEGLNFVPGRHQFMPEAIPVLQELLRVMQQHPNLKIEIQGHVCCTPGDADAFDEDSGNKQLSVNRAKAVYDYLRRNRIPAARLRYKGFAHSRLKVPETSPDNEQINRRVEILIFEK